MLQRLTFDNITLSGGAGSGKSLLRENLMFLLSPFGFRFISTGQIVRDLTHDNIMPSAEKVSSEFDRKQEDKVFEILAHEQFWVIDGWLAGWIARDLERTLRVLVINSDDNLRAKRIASRDKVSLNEAFSMMKEREEKNFAKWEKVYGAKDFFDPNYYHLVVDTAKYGPFATVGQVLDKFGVHPRDYQGQEITEKQ